MKIRYEGITDPVQKAVFQDLEQDLSLISQLKGFKFVKITIPKAVTNYKFTHGLGFKPLDILQLSLTGAGTLTWNYANFDKNYLDITTSGACVVRALVGAYLGDNS